MTLPHDAAGSGPAVLLLHNGAVEVTRDLLQRLDRLVPVIGAVAATEPERTLSAAAESDRRLRAGEARPLEGVPFTVKDWIDVESWPVLGAQRMLVEAEPDRFFVPPYVGQRGWLGVYLDVPVDWDEMRSIVEGAYRAIAPRRLVAELVSRTATAG